MITRVAGGAFWRQIRRRQVPLNTRIFGVLITCAMDMRLAALAGYPRLSLARQWLRAWRLTSDTPRVKFGIALVPKSQPAVPFPRGTLFFTERKRA